MKVGAVITAAGMSSRMGDFKQLMKIGPYPMIEHLIRKFKQAGVEDIVIVTGYKSDMLREALAKYDIEFVYNCNYDRTQMFDSVKLGLDYIKDKVDRILYCPCDIVLFSIDTVRKIKGSDGLIVIPTFKGKSGHPVSIESNLIESILEYTGDDGLRGAMRKTRVDYTYIEVDDIGILMDADTRIDYERVIEQYEREE